MATLEEEKIRQDKLIEEKLAVDRELERSRASERISGLGVGTAPIWKDLGKAASAVGDVALKAGEVAGKTGAGLLNFANDVVGYTTGKRSDVVDNITKNFNTVTRSEDPAVKKKPVSSSPTEDRAGAIMPAQDKTESKLGLGIVPSASTAPTSVAPVSEEKPVSKVVKDPGEIIDTNVAGAESFHYPKDAHPTQLKETDIYRYARKLNPDQFKDFVDGNRDDPNFRGFGYLMTNDPKTGQKKLDRIITPAAKGPEAANEELAKTLQTIVRALTGKSKLQVDMGGLNKDELAAVGGLGGHVVAAKEGGKAREFAASESRAAKEYAADQLLEGRKEIAAAARLALMEKNEAKKEEKLAKAETTQTAAIERVGKTEDILTGEKKISHTLGIHRLLREGTKPEEFVGRYAPIAHKLSGSWNAYIERFRNNNSGRAPNAEDLKIMEGKFKEKVIDAWE